VPVSLGKPGVAVTELVVRDVRVKVDFVIDEIVEGMLESTGEDLFIELIRMNLLCE
jgi:hypothetical protein